MQPRTDRKLDIAIKDIGVLAEQVRNGDQSGIATFFGTINRAIRFLVARQLRPELVDDTVHDAFLAIVAAVQNGKLEQPNALIPFAWTIIKRQINRRIEEEMKARRERDLESGFYHKSGGATPEQIIAKAERIALMRQVLLELSIKDREVLIRFYLHEQTQEHICDTMRLTDTQFRLIKSRAKSRFGKLGRQKLGRAALYAKPTFSASRTSHGA